MRTTFVTALLVLSTTLAPSAHALTMVYTDRAAWEAAAGQVTDLDMANPTIVNNPFQSTIHVTYSTVLQFQFDSPTYLGVRGGPLTVNGLGLLWFGQTLAPVTALGFDILRGDIHSDLIIGGAAGGSDYIPTQGLSFLGIVSSEAMQIGLGSHGCPGMGTTCATTIDRISIASAVPEPAYGLLLPFVGLALIWARRQLA